MKFTILCLVFIITKAEDNIQAYCKFTQNLNSGITGIVKFEQSSLGGATKVKGEVNSLANYQHAFHIHESPLVGNNCTTTGAHYNPFNTQHGDRTVDKNLRHVGDLGNVVKNTKNPLTTFEYKDEIISLIGDYSIIGKACVFHEGVDDLGKGEGTSKANGNAGSRIGCGTVFQGNSSSLFKLSYLGIMSIIILLF